MKLFFWLYSFPSVTIMSKVHKKRRVARVNSDVTKDGFSSGCFDLIDPIIKGMNFNISNKVQSNNFKFGSKVNGHEKMSNFAPSTSKESTQTSIKSKNFGLARKFPLMEKTQRTLKHIKHNQRIPKQRAHLASFSEPPIKGNNDQSNSGMVAQEGRNKRKINNSVPQAKSSGNVSSMNIKKKTLTRNKKSADFSTSESEEDSSINSSKMLKVSSDKSINKNVEKRCNFRGTENNNLSNSSNIVNNTDNDTTDSEYEKFIQNSKKGLVKRKRKNKGSTKGSKKAKKSTVRKKVSKVNHSDSSNESISYKTRDNAERLVESEESEYSEVEKNYCESNNSPMNYDTHDTANRLVESEESEYSEVEKNYCDYDTYTRDSSESDAANFKETVHNSVGSQLVEQKSNEKLTIETQSFNAINSLPDTPFEDILNTLVPVKYVEQDNPSNTSSMLDAAVCENMYSDSVSSSSNLMNISQNLTQIDNEESDLEIIEEIPSKSKNREIRADNNPCVSANNTKNVNLNKVSCQSSVETELLPICEIKVEKQKRQYNDEYGAVYTTDICRKEIDSKVNVLKAPPADKNISEVCEVKKEDSDDDIIIDFIVPAKNGKFTNSASNKLVCSEMAQMKTQVPKSVSDKIPNVKSENSFQNVISISKEDSSSCPNAKSLSSNEKVSLNDFKFACSNLAYTANLTGKMQDNFQTSVQPKQLEKQIENKDVKHLIDLFKKEFQVYEEILQTESNVEASLKLLETRQAEKLQSIRSLISKHLGNKQCDNLSINEQRNLMFQTQNISEAGASPKAFSDIFSEKTTAMVQNVSTSQKIILPPPVHEDEKPNVSLLGDISLSIPYQQSLLKPKSEPYDSSNTFRLLGEKCNLCGKEAMAACQRCAKVFFCSNECGKKYWEDGHEMECGK